MILWQCGVNWNFLQIRKCKNTYENLFTLNFDHILPLAPIILIVKLECKTIPSTHTRSQTHSLYIHLPLVIPNGLITTKAIYLHLRFLLREKVTFPHRRPFTQSALDHLHTHTHFHFLFHINQRNDLPCTTLCNTLYQWYVYILNHTCESINPNTRTVCLSLTNDYRSPFTT